MNTLIFGASGAIGQACDQQMKLNSASTFRVGRKISPLVDIELVNFKSFCQARDNIFDAVIWAQGINISDIAGTTQSLKNVLDINLNFIVETFQVLLNTNVLSPQCRLVVVSSVWQELSKTEKFSYTVSKAALKGLVNSITADYSTLGISINAVLPGVIDTKMTRDNLTRDQISSIVEQTPSHSLIKIEDVARAVYWLCSPDSKGISGQFIIIDNGWSHVRKL